MGAGRGLMVELRSRTPRARPSPRCFGDPRAAGTRDSPVFASLTPATQFLSLTTLEESTDVIFASVLALLLAMGLSRFGLERKLVLC